MSLELSPFACSHSPNLPELLRKLNCTLAISTYQAGKVVLISAKDDNRLIQLPRSFQKPMGIATEGDKLAIATQTEVVVLKNSRQMALSYPKQPSTYDALYLPRASYFTGEVDIHDLHWAKDTLWAVNTRFSCLATIDHNFSFIPKWKPFFIDKITPDDQCHLNGVAFVDDKPKYVTAIGKSDIGGGWRATKTTGGILMDVESNKIIGEGLRMPHSPRVYNQEIYLLESASGNITKINPATGEKIIVASLNGFARGMDRIGDFLFVGLSKLRTTSSAFKDLPIAKKSIFAGIAVIHMPTWHTVAYLKYENSVEEIYDVRILPQMKRPNILNHIKMENRIALATPIGDYWALMKDENKME